ncbi:MAG: D-2-hydroxyacid dehydrogenase family protein [Hyphomicrobiales bacterium]|nr:D-2-hydroxyacid dehydrogenase family protein [Hyphomicrobiales bacterium]
MELRCAILDDYQEVALAMADWSALEGKVGLETFADHIQPGALPDRLAGFDIIVAMRERTVFDAALLSRLPKLKLLITTGMANAAIDTEAAERLGILVCGTGGTVGPAAELAWGLLLALVRKIPTEVANLRAGSDRWQMAVGGGLQGKTLGVVGIGRLGRLTCGYGRAFGMDVIGWSRSLTPEKSGELGIAYAAALNDLLERSDVVCLQLKLTEETHGIIGRREIGLMRQGAILVNTARGPLVDEAALIEALGNGRLAGAALDVFEQEPLPPGHPFRTLRNVVATPHLGYVTEETYRIFFADAAEDVAAWLAGKPERALNAPAAGKNAS